MQIEPSEVFERPALAWLFREAQRLADTLAEHGVSAGPSRKIVDAFGWQFSVGLHQHAVMTDGRSYTPALTFLDERVALAADPNTFDCHDYALGVVGEVSGEAEVDGFGNAATENPKAAAQSAFTADPATR